MSTYAGTTSAKRAMGETIWLALVTFVAAAALVLALVATQRTVVTNQRPAGIATAAPVTHFDFPRSGPSGSLPKQVVVNHQVCRQCVPLP